MKSSLINVLPWSRTHHRSSHKSKPESSHQKLTKSGGEIDDMKDSYFHPQHSHTRQRKWPPLLRLDSEGEISTGKNFCDKATSNKLVKINKQLRLSNSVDSSYSYNNTMAATPESVGKSTASKSFESSTKNIPNHPSFRKSLSDPSGFTIHQSFPPPSSSLSAIRNTLSCPATTGLSPYSSSPRLLGIVNIFGVKSQDSSTMDKCKKSMTVLSTCKDKSKTGMLDNNDSSLSVLFASVEDNVSQQSNEKNQNEKLYKTCSNVQCNPDSSQNSAQSFNGGDSSSIVIIRKKKRKRPRNRKKKECKQDYSASATFRPSSCSSPLKNNSEFNSKAGKRLQDTSATSGVLNVKIVSPICHVFSKSKESEDPSLTSESTVSFLSNQSCLASRLFTSDNEHSVEEEQLSDDDLVFEDSNAVPVEDITPLSNSKLTAKNRKCKKSNKSFETSDESDDEQKSSSVSGLHFSLSLTFSEDEENDSSVDWDLSSSPSENNHFFEFEFSSGLCLDNILNRGSSSDSSETEKKVVDKRLRDINLKWDKFYASSSEKRESSLEMSNRQKVHFAVDDHLETLHIVGNEDRGGDWQRLALERCRFKKRIEDVENILAPFLSVNHRAKVFESMSK